VNKDILGLSIGLVISGATVANDLDAFLDLELDDLSGFDVEMETAAKNTQSLNDIPASVYVISNERIIRSGYSSIAELLSLVPGFLTTKYSENGYDISSKGFHDSFYNKLLIMVDGRSVYSPIYGGTYMADLDYLIADIEQIEVVRGPAGTMWGANSANGVVNIITKSAQNSQGTHVSGYAGDYNNYSAEARHGFAFGDYSFAKVFYKYKHSPSTLSDDAFVRESHQYGAAYEFYSDKHTVLLQVGGETSQEGTTQMWLSTDDGLYYTDSYVESEIESHSWNLNLKHKFEQNENTTFNSTFFVNYDKDDDPFASGNYTHFDLDTYVTKNIFQSTTLVLGLGGRIVDISFDDHISSIDASHYLVGKHAAVNDTEFNHFAFNLYGQVETWLTDSVKLIAGAKLEHFEQNGTTELSPQLRALYNINNQHALWAGIARAVMLPSYIDSQMDSMSAFEYEEGILYPDLYLSDDELENESVVTAEIGYRYSPNSTLDLDSVFFMSQYKNLRGVSYMDFGYTDPSRVEQNEIYDGWASSSFSSYLNSDYDADTYGIEVSLNYSPVDNWSIYTSYGYLNIESDWTGTARADEDPYYAGTYGTEYYDITGQHTATIQSLWSITDQFDFDVVAKYFNQTFHQDASVYEVDPFASLDARLAWKKQQSWPTVELIAQNVLGAGYSYLNPEVADYSYINEQKWYARLTYDF
jgi:iron complex outermembrane receptor protein